MSSLETSLLEKIGGVIGFSIYAYLLYRQNRIMEETNRIMREQGGGAVPLRPPWRLKNYWPMVLMAALTLATWIAIGLFFYFRKPVVIEKIVEKPVEKVVEKLVPQKCPKAPACPKPQALAPQPALLIPPNTKIEANANGPDSMAAGINTGTMIKGDAPPQMTLTKLSENVLENGRFRTQFRMVITTQRAFVLYLKATSSSLEGGILWDRDRLDPRQGGYSSTAINVFSGVGYAEEDIENVVAATYTVTLYTSKPDIVKLEYKEH
jgi:hypothetical protein